MARRIQILDTTLRDGNKLPFVALSPMDRLVLARRLERLGVDVIEAGFPVSSPEESECVSRIAGELKESSVSALARALPRDVEETLGVLRKAAKPYLHVFMPASPEALSGVVKMSGSRAVEAVRKSVGLGKRAGVRVQFSISEAPQAEEEFRKELCRAARESGAEVLNFADTYGVLLPEEVKILVEGTLALFPAEDAPTVGVHCHNDLGLAGANTLAAIQAGASHVEVTLSGYGERAGNAALEEIAFLIEAFGERHSVSHGIVLSEIAGASRLLEEITGIHTHPNKPVIGKCALERTGNGERPGPLAPRLRRLLRAETIGGAAEEETDREQREGTGGSGLLFRLDSFSVLTGSHAPPVGIVVIDRKGSRVTQSSHGSGPIDALFKAVDRALGFSPRLVYYSLYTLSTGPEAPAEVSVTTELRGRRFHGRHRSTDVIEASLRAYMNACESMGESGILDGDGDHYVHGEYLWE
jgi:2-isopropylmalate synthase